MQKYSIFYDLETTDRTFIGQILNFCFIRVDENFNEVGTLANRIKISCLQLPSAGAILTNRIDVIEHQATSTLSEGQAGREIVDFINETIALNKNNSVPLIGYNSGRFDLQYLRTTLMRNGINPYFGGKLLYRDLLHTSKRLAMVAPDFPRKPKNGGDKTRISLSLENLTRYFGLLDGPQTHDSVDDVLITIELAKKFRDQFGVDVRTTEGYDVELKFRSKGTIIASLEPEYELSKTAVCPKAYMLLDSDRKYSLWVNLERLTKENPQKAIRFFNHSTDFMMAADLKDYDELDQSKIETLKDTALNSLGTISLKNYFTTSHCDIEQDIYRIDFSQLEALSKAIQDGDSRALPSRDSKILYTRYQMRCAGDDIDRLDEVNKGRFLKHLKEYALHRYGGELKLSKYENVEEARPGIDLHYNWNELLQEIDQRWQSGDNGDRYLMGRLKEFYERSLVASISGEMLTSIKHRSAESRVRQVNAGDSSNAKAQREL